MGEPVRTTDVRRQFQLGDTVFAVLMLIAAVLLIVTLLGSRLVSEARELTLLQVAGATPARVALLIAPEHALLAVIGAAAGRSSPCSA